VSGYRWSLGTMIGLPASILGCVVLAGCIWLAWRWVVKSRGDEFGEHGMALGIFGLAVLSLLCAIVGIAWGMWPYDAEYHQWRETSGTVQTIDSRFVGADRSTTERFVVTFDDGRQRSCDDTRCAQVREGDGLTLACKRAWQWAGTHGYDCNYVDHRPVR
jgi:hypothetical protein